MADILEEFRWFSSRSHHPHDYFARFHFEGHILPHILAEIALILAIIARPRSRNESWLHQLHKIKILISTIIFCSDRRERIMGPTKCGPINGRNLRFLPYGHPEGVPIIGRDFFFIVLARPLAFGSFPARIMPTLRVGIWKNVPFFHYILYLCARTYTRGKISILAKNNTI